MHPRKCEPTESSGVAPLSPNRIQDRPRRSLRNQPPVYNCAHALGGVYSKPLQHQTLFCLREQVSFSPKTTPLPQKPWNFSGHTFSSLVASTPLFVHIARYILTAKTAFLYSVRNIAMTTFQRPLQFCPIVSDEKRPVYTYLSSLSQASASPTDSSSSFSSQEDLLPDLWLETKPRLATHFENMWKLQPPVMLREASLEYAQSLLPHSLLAPLTEENLDFQARFDYPDEIFNFEQQQAQQARPCHKLRNSSFSSSASAKAHHQNHQNQQNQQNQTRNINTQLYKTELCGSFINMGMCPYGNKCQFAHGQHELKVVERPANWRSKPCANWAKFGSCRYGKRCCFKHGA